MIEKKLTTYFARYKKLMPSAEFLHRSKTTIAFAKQEAVGFGGLRSRIVESLTASGALALASLLLLVVLGSISYIGSKTGATLVQNSTTDAETTALLKEASLLVSSVQLKEVDSFAESSEQMVSALDILSKKLSR
jgi:hypothetical protein